MASLTSSVGVVTVSLRKSIIFITYSFNFIDPFLAAASVFLATA